MADLSPACPASAASLRAAPTLPTLRAFSVTPVPASPGPSRVAQTGRKGRHKEPRPCGSGVPHGSHRRPGFSRTLFKAGCTSIHLFACLFKPVEWVLAMVSNLFWAMDHSRNPKRTPEPHPRKRHMCKQFDQQRRGVADSRNGSMEPRLRTLSLEAEEI